MHLSHIYHGVRLAGLEPTQVQVHKSRHVHIQLPNNRSVFASSTPKDRHTAALRVAADIRRVLAETPNAR